MILRGMARIPVTLVLSLLCRKHVKRVDPYHRDLCDQPDSIFISKTSGIGGIEVGVVPFCWANTVPDHGGSGCLSPKEGDIVVTLVNGQRFIV